MAKMPEVIFTFNDIEDNAAIMINMLIDCYEVNDKEVDWSIVGAMTSKLRKLREGGKKDEART